MYKKTITMLLAGMLAAGSALATGTTGLSWGSTDLRYAADEQFAAAPAPALTAWKGERINAQAVFRCTEPGELTLSFSDLKSGKKLIPAGSISGGIVEPTICDYYGHKGENVSLQPDRIVLGGKYSIEAGTKPIWISIQVPQDAASGKYKGTVKVKFNGAESTLPLTLTVIDHLLPEPSQWAFHLDLWQNPYAVARWFDLPLWSEEHLAAMRPIIEKYAAAGGKVITTSIIRHPWNGQTFDPFESMVAKTRKLDGSWEYDYSVFDKWVEFAMSCGVTEQIDCYTIVPWGYNFEYFDVATATVKLIDCKPGEQAYEDFILPLLTDLARHLKEKGWFEKTCIAMDERPMDQLRAARKVLLAADPEYRIKGAVNYSPEVVDLMYDISIIYQYSDMPQAVVDQRRTDHLHTTIYTCCQPEHPNTFTFSPLAESEFIGLSAAARGYSGYLRWALNSWPENPCKDSRYSKWLSGDTYLLYPEGPSTRFERLIQGIQDYEKLRILKASADAETLSRIEAILAPFKEVVTDDSLDAAGMVNKARIEINKL